MSDEWVDGDYDCEVVVLADGWKFTLQDFYSSSPVLLIRQPGSVKESKHPLSSSLITSELIGAARTVFTDVSQNTSLRHATSCLPYIG